MKNIQNLKPTLKYSNGLKPLLIAVFLCGIVFYSDAQTKTVCLTGCDYTSLTNTGGAFDAINATTLTANMNLEIAGDLTSETGTIALNAVAAPYTVKIYPTGIARTISGTGTAKGLVVLNGADRITIDGSLNGTGIDKSLTINNAATSFSGTITLLSLGDGAGAINNTIRNCNISHTTKAGYGVYVGSYNNSLASGSDNDNTTIQNNTIFRTQQAITVSGTTTGLIDNLTITGNILGSNVSGEELRQTAILTSNVTGMLVSNNTVKNIILTSGIANDMWGMSIGATNSTITNNNITGINFTGSGGAPIGYGISVNGSGNTLSNNAISDIKGGSSAQGISIFGTGNKLYYNSVNLNSGVTPSKALVISSSSGLDIRDNIFAASSGSAAAYAIYSSVANTAFSNLNYNDYYVSGTQGILGFIGSNRTDLAGIVTGFGQNANSVSIAPAFLTATDLHIAPNAPVENIGIPIAAVLTDIDAEMRSSIAPDMGIDEHFTAIDLTKTVCASGCDYTSLTNTGGAFSAINAMTLEGNVALQIAGDLTAETGTNMLNAFTAPNQVRIYPTGAARTISGTGPSNLPMIGLYGADRVLIDGSLNGTGTDKSLTITTNAAAVIGLLSLGDGAGASNNTIRNCVISRTTKSGYGICLTGSNIPSTFGSDNDNNTIQNNTIFKVQQAIVAYSLSTGISDNLTITGNTFGSYTTGDEIAQTAMSISGVSGLTVSANTIQNIIMDHSIANDIWGININAANAVISGNTIKGVAFTSNFSYPESGMSISGTGITIANNAISDIKGGSGAYGIRLNGSSSSGINVYYNSVNLNSGTTPSRALYIADGNSLDIRNNIFTAASGSAAAYAIYSAKANTAFSNINYNDYYVSGTQGILGFLGSDRINLAGIVSAFGQNANSINIAPVFTSATDLHLMATGNNSLINLGTPISSVTIDFDGQTRDAAAPDMGMDEFDCGSPTGFTYTSNTASYYTRFAITENSPSFTTGTAISYGISPALPAGLSLDVTTGIISGTPTVTSAAANYTVTATSNCGSTTKVINLAVISSASAADNALAFDGTDDFVSIPVQSTAVTNNFTVEAWVKPADATKIMHVISSRNGADFSFDIQLRYGTQIHGDIGNGSSWITTAADAAFNYAVNTWLHIAYVVTPAGYKIYANGNQVGSGTFAAVPMLYNTSGYLTLGKSAAELTLLKGSMDDVRIYNTSLTAAQILEDAKGSYLATGLIAYYNFDEGVSGGTNTGLNKLFEQTEAGTFHAALNNFTLTGSTSNWANGQSVQSQSITFNALGNKAFGSGSFTLSASAGSGLTVSYASSNPAVATVSGNTVTITGIGTTTITASQAGNLFYNAATAVTQVLTVTAPVVNLKLFVQGYYTGSGMMASVKNNQDYVSGMTEVEDLTVELHHPATYALVAVATATLQTNGTISCAFPTGPNGSFYIVVKGKNIIQTWSAVPQTVGNTPLNYDFTGSAAMAYGNNLKQVEPGVWAVYSGDTNGDDIIDPTDYSQWESDFNNFSFGVFATDLNGDGIVDPSDYTIWEENFNSFIYADYPF